MPENHEDVLEMNDAAASMNLSKEVKQVMELLSEAINYVFYIYSADFRDLEELHEAETREEIAMSVDFLLHEPFYNVER